METVNTVLAVLLVASFALNAVQGIFRQNRKVALLEAQMLYLFENSGAPYEPETVLAPAIRKAAAEGHQIVAIKLYRDATGSSLRAAKATVDKILS